MSDNEKTIIKYSELAKSGTVYCKISKSSREISKDCVEPYYVDYSKKGVVHAAMPREAGDYASLSFVPISTAVLAIPYGDTLTILNTSWGISKILCNNVQVEHIGGMFNEFRASQIIVKENRPLSDVQTNRELISQTDEISLVRAAMPALERLRISRHYEALGFDEPAALWKSIEKNVQQYVKDEHGYIGAGKKIKKIYGLQLETMKQNEMRSKIDSEISR